MKVVYRLDGLGGGEWLVTGLFHNSVKATPYEVSYQNLSGIEEAVQVSNSYFAEKISLNRNNAETVELYTNASRDAVSQLCDRVEDTPVKCKIQCGYTPDNLPETDYLWSIADYIWHDGRYDMNPLKTPKPPYTVYTDASYWPQGDKQSSIGFVICGNKGGCFILGSPVANGIQDNNVAEYYAVLSALSVIPKEHTVTINTDSMNVCSLTDNDSNNPQFDVVSELTTKIYSFNSVSINYVDRKWTMVADRLAEIGKEKPVVIGEKPAE